jgi:hypothetical protein
VNPLINELVRRRMADFVGGLFAHPRVELHTAEARAFVRGSRERYDVIMASHTISNAATASGALSLAESYVMTREAFVDYLAHLSPRGRLWFTRPEAQLPRMVATAREALAERGVEDAGARLVVFAGAAAPSFYGGLLLSLEPIGAAELARMATTLARARLRALYLPGRDDGPALYRSLARGGRAERERLYAASALRLEPATDERPFFNQRARWRDLGGGALARLFDQSGDAGRTRLALEDQPIAEAVLAVTLVQSAALAVCLIVLPLVVRLRRVDVGPAGGLPRLLAYFSCLGLGFILCEVALIQRLTLFLGQPIYTFAVVVGSLLVSSGAGSLLSARLARVEGRIRGRLPLALCAVAGLLLLFAYASPPLLRAALGWPLAARAALAVLLIAPLGLAMGTPFPLGLRVAGARAPGAIPWAWAVNAVASVVGSVLAMVLATEVGFGSVLVLAAATYLVAAALDPARR